MISIDFYANQGLFNPAKCLARSHLSCIIFSVIGMVASASPVTVWPDRVADRCFSIDEPVATGVRWRLFPPQRLAVLRIPI